MSWRFLLPGQSQSVKLHRAVLVHSWDGLPRWQWVGILVYSFCTWILFWSWQQSIQIFRRYAGETRRHFQISFMQQGVDLICLSVLHGIPPHCYYRYGLFRQPHQRWFDYVYPHELPHWHRVMGGKRDISRAVDLLSDKNKFAERMSRAGIQAIPSISCIANGPETQWQALFIRQSLFGKPNWGSRGQGCFALIFDGQAEEYTLLTEDKKTKGKQAISEKLTIQLTATEYLIQPLLKNHPEIEDLCKTTDLVTIRVITGHNGEMAICTHAILEIPRPDNHRLWQLFNIDCQTGYICASTPSLTVIQRDPTIAPLKLAGSKLPYWEDVMQICQQAHEHATDMLTVGWDVAITLSGAVLIEGNVIWDVAPHQMLSGAPLLSSRLLDVYLSRLGK